MSIRVSGKVAPASNYAQSSWLPAAGRSNMMQRCSCSVPTRPVLSPVPAQPRQLWRGSATSAGLASSSRVLEASPWLDCVTADLGLPDGTAWAWDLTAMRLATVANILVTGGVRDPFLWQAIRLRARILVWSLGLCEVSTLLACCVKVGLSDEAFLNDMCVRLETILRCGGVSVVQGGALVSSCNSLLRLGLDVTAPLFEDLLTIISLSASRLSACDAAVLATCLSRLKCADIVLMRRAADRLVKGAGSTSVRQDAMVFSSIAELRRASETMKSLDSMQEKIASRLLAKLSTGACISVSSTTSTDSTARRSLLSLLSAEVMLQLQSEEKFCEPSLLAMAVLRQLEGCRRLVGRPAELHRVARACKHWGSSRDVAITLAPRALQELAAWLNGRRPTWPGLDNDRLLMLFSATFPPLCAAIDAGSEANLDPVHRLFDHIRDAAPDLSNDQLLLAIELSATAVGIGALPCIGPEVLQEQVDPPPLATAFCSEVQRRALELPLRDLPRALGSLLQLVTPLLLLPVLRRCIGRLAVDLADMLQAASPPSMDKHDSAILSGDGLGDILYVCAACKYTDDGFLNVSREWLLAHDAAILKAVRRDVSLVHLLHSLADLGAVHGDLVTAIIDETDVRLPGFGAFELLGFLDATLLLQSQGPAAGAQVHPLGIGQHSLRIALARVEEILPTIGGAELQTYVHVLQSLELPAGTEGVVASSASFLAAYEANMASNTTSYMAA